MLQNRFFVKWSSSFDQQNHRDNARLNLFCFYLLQENPYLALQMEEEAEPSQGYYMQPCDDAGIRESKRYVKSPVQSPSSDSKEPPNFKDAANAVGDGMGYVPTL